MPNGANCQALCLELDGMRQRQNFPRCQINKKLPEQKDYLKTFVFTDPIRSVHLHHSLARNGCGYDQACQGADSGGQVVRILRTPLQLNKARKQKGRPGAQHHKRREQGTNQRVLAAPNWAEIAPDILTKPDDIRQA